MIDSREIGQKHLVRRKAERVVNACFGNSPAPGEGADVQRLIHELQVHQVELEIQNAELRQARNEVERGLQRYTDLYDFAPIAYLSLDYRLSIRQVNLAAAELLQSGRASLIGQPLTPFIAAADRARFGDFARGALASPERSTCEVALLRADGAHLHCQVRIEAVSDSSGALLRAALLDITEQTRMQHVIWHQANYDALTQLPNRSLFLDRLRHELEVTRRAGQTLAVLFIDLDRFKAVNDTFGHETGDSLLAEAARRMSQCVRTTDTLARRGGDEFYLILSALTDTDRVGEVARDILAALADTFWIGEARLNVSASIGIASYPLDTCVPEELLRKADQAMYQAKSAGRNRFSYFTPALQVSAQRRLDLIRDLRNALPGEQFALHYQPVVELATGLIVGAEAMLRWQHPMRGLVGAADFMAAADAVGISIRLGNWVFGEALRYARRWREETGRHVQMSVNVSRRTLAHAGSAAGWARLLKAADVDGRHITIDVGEDVLHDNAPEVEGELRRVRELGMTVALEGFGQGHSALASLTRVEVGAIKLCRSLVAQLTTNPAAGQLVEAIVLMAHKLDIRVVGEGIETRAQRDILRAAGCDLGQGFMFCPAVPPEHFWARGDYLHA